MIEQARSNCNVSRPINHRLDSSTDANRRRLRSCGLAMFVRAKSHQVHIFYRRHCSLSDHHRFWKGQSKLIDVRGGLIASANKNKSIYLNNRCCLLFETLVYLRLTDCYAWLTILGLITGQEKRHHAHNSGEACGIAVIRLRWAW